MLTVAALTRVYSRENVSIQIQIMRGLIFDTSADVELFFHTMF